MRAGRRSPCVLRKVIEVRDHPEMPLRKLERLECGHAMLQAVDLAGQPRPAQRRRCKKCGRVEKVTVVKTRILRVKVRSKPRHHRERTESNDELIRRALAKDGYVRLRIALQVRDPASGQYQGLQRTAVVLAVRSEQMVREISRQIERVVLALACRAA